ncbi:uncharacterized protein LOC142584182 [Dermacentor variabilis]|uniref:uncharacterized protein LOC142584182 n=1 Tax=Dermacentor variabilis TaxID=34621 RepID=UPI003F5BB4BA
MRLYILLSFFISCSRQFFVRACRGNEAWMLCDEYRLPEEACPGWHPTHCLADRGQCGCGDNAYRRKDGECVGYADCVPSEIKPLELLGSKHELVMVGASKSMIDSSKAKCFKTGLQWHKNGIYEHELQYEKFNKRKKWEKREISIELKVKKDNGESIIKVERAAIIKEPKKVSERLNKRIQVLYANFLCLITGHENAGGKPLCTYWVPKWALKQRNWPCQFKFNNTCDTPKHYNIHDFKKDCKRVKNDR